ncbi:MAG: hypothetical protein LBI43_02345 [Streptococcaceae bacterium]|jgi:competence protein ComX|nr:hypothetical protein [Streptococcaceae bacterium]
MAKTTPAEGISNDELMAAFEKVRPIILNARKQFCISLWDLDDYLQEGIIILYQLMLSGCSEEKLPIHFKVKYRSHLISTFRKETASKRNIKTSNYQFAGPIHYNVADPAAEIEKEMLYEERKESFIETLNAKEKQTLWALLERRPVERIKKFRLKQRFIQFLMENDEL